MTAEKIYWQRYDGGRIDLTDGTDWDVLQGVDGRYMPAFDYVADEVFTYTGQIVRTVKTQPREVKIPLAVYGSTSADLRANQRVLTAAFGPVNGRGKLVVVTSDGLTRMLNCYFYGGMSMEESYNTGSCTFRVFDTTFIAHDPYWFDPAEVEHRVWDPACDSMTSTVMYNNGDVEAWPIWTVTGPCTAWAINNSASWVNLNMTYTLTNTENAVYIDTRPFSRSVLKNHTTNLFKYLNVGSTMFPLIPGANFIEFVVTQAAYEATLNIVCRYVERYYGV